jgi:predicted DNA-binding transcriptional regulator YafY
MLQGVHMAKSKRLIELMMAVNRKKEFTVKEMAEEFGVSVRTMHRDLQELSEIGMPLYSEFGPHGGYRLLRERVLPPIMFAESEAVAMFFALQSLQFYGALPFEAQSLSALHKFYHYLPDDTKERIDTLRDRVSFWTPLRTVGSPFLDAILDASLRLVPVHVRYSSGSSESERVIQPIGIYSYNGYWYCPSYCFEKEAFLLFRVDRIMKLETAAEGHQSLDLHSYTIADWLQAPHKFAENLRMKTLRVRLTREGVRKCELLPSFGTDILKQPDGTGRLETMMHEENIAHFASIFLGFGSNAVIEEPIEMVRWIQDQIRSLANIYL